jgi:hypothetical protein
MASAKLQKSILLQVIPQNYSCTLGTVSSVSIEGIMLRHVFSNLSNGLRVVKACLSRTPNIILIIAFGLAMPAVANAQSVQNTLRDFGIMGTWANNCSTAASESNYYTVFAVSASGKATRTQYTKPNVVFNEYIIASAKRVATNQLWYLQVSNNNAAGKVEVVVIKDGDRYRYLSSKISGTDAFFILDGKFVKGGVESAWSFKCK